MVRDVDYDWALARDVFGWSKEKITDWIVNGYKDERVTVALLGLTANRHTRNDPWRPDEPTEEDHDSE